MKRLLLLATAAALSLLCQTAQAAFSVVGANGKDGIFAPPAGDVYVDLSKAQTLPWDTDQETGGNGVYDPEKWAVVFRYQSVTIPAGTTVRFINHQSRAPVVWLVSGDVIIDGNGWVQLNGQPATDAQFAAPGPGGFRGGRPGVQGRLGSGGFGIGGGPHLLNAALGGHVEKFGTENAAYGDDAISFLIGGSGGGGSPEGYTGSAGAGAILIACQGEVRINGWLTANADNANHQGSGSGGAIKIVANRLTGSGQVQALGKQYVSRGRIRLEAVEANNNLNCVPDPSFVLIDPVEYLPFRPLAPIARIKAVSATDAPLDPKANLGANPADVTLSNPGNATILLETENFEPTTGQITLYITPTSGPRRAVEAALKPGGTFAKSEWELSADLPAGSYAMQAHAVTRP